MKKALIVLAAVAATCASTYAQASSAVTFKNRTILTPQPDPNLAGYIAGGNGNGSFNVPLYANNGDSILGNGNSTIGAGTLPGGVTVGIFSQGVQLATTLLGTTTASAPFFFTPNQQDVVIKDAAGNPLPPGSTPSITVRAWTTSSGSFAAAQTDPSGQWGEWTFNAPPLSGAGNPPSLPQTLTAWGNTPWNGNNPNYSNAGFELNAVPEPTTIALGVLGVGALVLARRRK